MRLVDDFNDQKLSLDMTPLIDIIFLLVMFFAVSTSFISGDDLTKLKTDLLSVTESSQSLDSELNSTREIYNELLVQSSNDQLKIDGLMEKIANVNESNEEFESQVLTLKTEAANFVSNEQLLTQLLSEQHKINESLQASETTLSEQKLQLAEQLALMQGLLDIKEEELSSVRDSESAERLSLNEKLNAAAAAVEQLNEKLALQQQQLLETLESRDAVSAQEVLLQKLIAEKAAELSGMIVRLESVEAERNAAVQMVSEMDAAGKASRESLLSQLQKSQTDVLSLQSELSKYKNIADGDRLEIERAVLAQKQLKDGMSGYLEDNSLDITRDQKKLTLQLSDKILFASGSPEIKSDGLEVLQELGTILKEKAGELEVQIGGHTDNVPVGGKSGPLSDNWGLSAARAVNVVRFFEEELELEPNRMAAVGYGEYRPIGANETADGRSRNRRIEIVLIPR